MSRDSTERMQVWSALGADASADGIGGQKRLRRTGSPVTAHHPGRSEKSFAQEIFDPGT
jgi:hypothetical protein